MMKSSAKSWCKFGATLYRAILTIFTTSNGVLKTRRDHYPFGIISIQNSTHSWVLFFFFVGETCGLPRANAVRPYGVGDTLVPPFLFMNFSARSSPHTSIGGSICKEPRRPIYFLPFLWYNLTNR